VILSRTVFTATIDAPIGGIDIVGWHRLVEEHYVYETAEKDHDHMVSTAHYLRVYRPNQVTPRYVALTAPTCATAIRILTIWGDVDRRLSG
jgi:hypothetical protein